MRITHAALTMLLVTTPACLAGSQQWNDTRALTLIRQATDRRAQQLADSGLADYKANAHGYLTFLAQLGDGFREPPQVVKADELALQVYWHAPNLSKQRIIGRRDTTLLPTDIAYHRDHLGIVQNNFPAIIRLGDGDEVRDVPHPLSPIGLLLYDFAIADSLRILIPGRAISVYEVKVRPKDDRQPRVIGALYLDRDNAQVVRMALSFTRAAFLDKYLEDLFVVLENGLVGTRFWLPRRQEIEIRRTATWLDYPVRGIIRGRWEIGDYEINAGIPLTQFGGPEIVQAPATETRAHQWPTTRILDSLPPDVREVTADDVRRVQTEVRALVREQALRRARGSALAGRGVSDFARFNRVEGTSLGGGISARIGAGVAVLAQGRFGLDDHSPKGRVELRWQSARDASLAFYGARELRDVGIVPERSSFINSIAAQEFGSDCTDPYRVDAVGVAAAWPQGAWSWTLDVAHEDHAAARIHGVPATGKFEPTIAAPRGHAVYGRLIAERPTLLWVGGVELRSRFELRALPARLTADIEIQRPMGAVRLVARTVGGLVLRGPQSIPIASGPTGPGPAFKSGDEHSIYLGGPITGPGYEYHAFVSDGALSQRLELRAPVPFLAISLGRFGRSPASITVAPFVSVVATSDSYPRDPVYASAGIGLLYFFDVLRFDVARGLRNGRWTFSVDANRIFWSVL